MPQSFRITLADGQDVSALLLSPPRPSAAYVFAHGAGAGMTHPFMAQLAEQLCERGVATLRFQFPSMERGLKRPDAPPVAKATVRSACEEAARRFPGVPLFAGGKSFGGRMTSQAQAEEPLAGVRGLVFVGFPLHPAGVPATQRADHLARVDVPMLFLQGTRDALADLDLIRRVTDALDDRATLALFDDADHAFHVRAKSGSTDDAVLRALADAIAQWTATVAATRPRAI
jgi:predicted alpha/beta-hydrolase family hydrolase